MKNAPISKGDFWPLVCDFWPFVRSPARSVVLSDGIRSRWLICGARAVVYVDAGTGAGTEATGVGAGAG